MCSYSKRFFVNIEIWISIHYWYGRVSNIRTKIIVNITNKNLSVNTTKVVLSVFLDCMNWAYSWLSIKNSIKNTDYFQKLIIFGFIFSFIFAYSFDKFYKNFAIIKIPIPFNLVSNFRNLIDTKLVKVKKIRNETVLNCLSSHLKKDGGPKFFLSNFQGQTLTYFYSFKKCLE